MTATSHTQPAGPGWSAAAAPALSGRLSEVLLAAYIVLAWCSAPVLHFVFVDFQLFGSQPDPADYRAFALAAVTLAALVPILAGLAVVGLRRGPWLLALALTSSLVHLLMAAAAWSSSRTAYWRGTPDAFDPVEAMSSVLVVPTTWPLLLAAGVGLSASVVRRTRAGRSA